ncbi:MAG: DUF58 domain-containing protein [Acidimicrobiia bacterium]|nr:DUF58 domain-containing protein [Acidimicrobiia bacterium]
MTTPVLTRRLVVVLVVGAGLVALVAGPRGLGFGVVAGTIALGAVIDGLLALSPSAIDVRRGLPAGAVLGEAVQARWVITNRADRRTDVRVADSFAPSLAAATRRCSVHLPAWATATVDITLNPGRRGRFVLDEVVIRTVGPLGLVGRQRARTTVDVLRVYPRFPSRADAELRLRRAQVAEVGLRTARGRGGGTEFDQLRDYTPDDEYRKLDWAATARAARPIVRDYRAEQNQTVINLLDNGRLMAGTVSGVPRVEHAMDAVMALTTVASGMGDKCGLLTFDQQVRSVVAAARGRHQLGLVNEAMYELEPVLAESDYRTAFTTALVRFRRRALLVIHTELASHSVEESLIPALPLLLRTHVVIVAAVTDPEVSGWATETVDEWPDVYRQAAAIGSLEDRRRAATRLRALGARVVDAGPDRLAVTLIDTYLGIKATGVL